MKTAWRVRTGAVVESLGDAVRDAPVGNVALAQVQARALASLGFRIVEVDSLAEVTGKGLVLVDNLYVSPALLRRFVKAARRRRTSSRLALPKGAFTALTTFTGEQEEDGETVLYGLWWCRRSLDDAQPLCIEGRSFDVRIPFSDRIATMSDQVVPVTAMVAIEITSWVHLWLANLYAIGSLLLELLRGPRGWLRGLLAVVLGVLTSFSLRPYAWATNTLARFVVRGRGCRIHPSAVVEACVIGRNVEIGPNAVVRGCILGDDVMIMERAGVEGSVLGQGVIINQGASIKAALAYPGAVFRFLQTGIVGRNTFLGVLCVPLDMKFQGTVRVRHRGELFDTGMPFMGCCIGHDCVISGGSRVEPGRVIPNGSRILTDMGAIREVPEGLDRTGFLVDRRGVVEEL